MRDFIIISDEDLDNLELRNAFTIESTPEERWKEECKKRLMFRQLRLIADKFLLTRERAMLNVYMFHNSYREELMMFINTDDRYYVSDVIKKVLKLLRKFVSFFLDNDYKKIDKLCREVLTEKEYQLIRLYLKLHTYRRVGSVYGITEEAIRIRLRGAIKKLNSYIEVRPLLNLIRSLQNYRYH